MIYYNNTHPTRPLRMYYVLCIMYCVLCIMYYVLCIVGKMKNEICLSIKRFSNYV